MSWKHDGWSPLDAADDRLSFTTILVAVDLDEPSALVLKMAARVASALEARLCLVHIPPRSSLASQTATELPRAAISRWIERTLEDPTAIDDQDVFVQYGDSADAFDEVTRLCEPDLVVAARPPRDAEALRLIATLAPMSARDAEGVASWTTHKTSRPCLLVADSTPPSSSVVAATDLSGGLLVVRTCVEIAEALGLGVTLVHKLDEDGPKQAGVRAVVARLQLLGQLGRVLSPVRAARVTTEPMVKTIGELVEATGAGVVAVGVRPGHGRTLNALLERCATASMLVVPLEPQPLMSDLTSLAG